MITSLFSLFGKFIGALGIGPGHPLLDPPLAI
jgi:hypothetical protein